jgi:uncharacterized heparinase superfamily protein
MSDGPHRIVVNCGAEHDDDNPWHTPTTTTAAHSTLIIEDTSQSLQNNTSAWRRFLPARNRQTRTSSHRTRQDGGTLIEATHDGYLDLFGLHHLRRIYMSDTGDDVRGEDIVEFPAPHTAPKAPVQSAVCTRFHIHPDIKVTRAQKSNAVLLLLPNRSGWTFTARGARLELEDSVYLEAKRPPRRTQQIALYGSVTKQTRIKWAFKRLEKAPKRKAATKSNPLNLPLLD